MVPEELLQSLAVRTPSKIALLVLGGLGGLPVDGRTELDAADTPFLDRLAGEGICGLVNPIRPGITPGCAQACLSLLGYDPMKYQVGNGVLEALGLGLDVQQGDVVAQGDFTTLDDRDVIAERFDPSMSSQTNRDLCRQVQEKAARIEDVEVTLAPGHEHRFAVRFRGPNLDGRLTNAEPHRFPGEAEPAKALVLDAERTESLVNAYIEEATKTIQDHVPSTTMVLRGFGTIPVLPSLNALYKLTPACIAPAPLQQGLGRLLGMELPETGDSPAAAFGALARGFEKYDFFYIYFGDPHRAGHRGEFDAKVKAIEEIDKQVPHLLALEPDVIVVTGDHSAPCLLRANSFHPTPCLIWAPYIRPDAVQRFDEIECSRGGLGRILSADLMSVVLGQAMKLKPYGS